MKKFLFACVILGLLGCGSSEKPQVKVKAVTQSNEVKSNSNSYKQAFDFQKNYTVGDEQGFDMPTGFVRHPKGVLVLDYKACKVTCYDDNWQEVFSFGKKGEGPGEMTRPISLTISNNIVNIYDIGNYRISEFDLDGEFIRQHNAERVIVNMVSLDNTFFLSYHHKQGKPDVEVKNQDFKTLAQINLRNTDEQTYMSRICIGSDKRIYAAAINKYIIEVYEPDGTFIREIKRDYETPKPLHFNPIRRKLTLSPVGALAVHDGHLFVLSGGHQSVYQMVSGKELDPKYDMRIDVFDLNGKLVSYFWDTDLEKKMEGVYNASVFTFDENGSLYLQDPSDQRLVHNYTVRKISAR